MANLKPAVPRYWLFALAGLVWSAAGLMLCWHAIQWLTRTHAAWSIPLGLGGIVVGLAVSRVMFLGIARKNIERISGAPDSACVFSFQTWRSYLLVGLMIALGILLRHSSIPRQYLAVGYMAMGTALLVASCQYHIQFWKRSIGKDHPPRE